MIETRLIPGYEGYRVTSEGKIESCWKRTRKAKSARWAMSEEWYEMKLQVKRKDYLGVGVRRKFKDQEWKDVHRLVCLAWHGVCPEGMECSHKNGNKQDNRPENLEYQTHKMNCAMKYDHGTGDFSHVWPRRLRVKLGF